MPFLFPRSCGVCAARPPRLCRPPAALGGDAGLLVPSGGPPGGPSGNRWAAFWPLRGAAAGRVLEGQGVNRLSSTPRIVGIVAAAVLAGGLAACSTSSKGAHPAAAGPASARPAPVLVQPNAVGWSGMVQRPDHIYVGMGGAPVVGQLAWRNWGGPRASAGGKLDIYWPQPGPISGWHPSTYPVTVRLQDISAHNGQRSYRKWRTPTSTAGGPRRCCISGSTSGRADQSRGGTRPRPGMAQDQLRRAPGKGRWRA